MNFSSRLKTDRLGSQGFTLIEVLIAMMLLVFISLAIYQTTTQIYRRRNILQNEGEFYNNIRLATNLMDRDVSMIYSPLLLLPGVTRQANAGSTEDTYSLLSSDLGRSTTFWNPAIDSSGIRPSRFIGTDSKMSFVSSSHVRIYRDNPESEFVKVTYELKEDRFRPVDDAQARVLVRTVNPSPFDERDDGRLIRTRESRERNYQILQGVRSMKIRYWRQDKERWENSWDSDTADLKDKIPDKIEVTLDVVGQDRLEFKASYKMRTEIPLDGLDSSL